jgi:hypothetical protein
MLEYFSMGLIGLGYFLLIVYFISEIIGYSGFVLVGFRLLLDLVFMIILPIVFLSLFDYELENDCCTDSAVFSPEHRITIYCLIFLAVISYFYTGYFLSKSFTTPIMEVILNCLLIVGIVINILMLIQVEEISLIGNLPALGLLIVRLFQNHKRLIEYANFDDEATGVIKQLVWILNRPFWYKLPILTLLCLPVFVLITSFLMIFGQKPDSFIRAFTDTYKHGLSQLDYECLDVYCPSGHYLCTIAAKGHEGIVKPVRIGKRNGKTIVCNRQLLVSNAFEELMQEKIPKTHRIIRNFYDKIGNFVHRYYGVFEYKFVSDFIYILMKPLEWFFIFTLYLLDKKPENRIAKQYLGNSK